MPPQNYFTQTLITWFSTAKRPLPWRATQDPYKIWLSEIILQQTRVEQGTPYYLRFVEHYPTVNDLANAREQQVLKLWEGLGYYSRARNLHATARFIANELHGVFPNSYAGLIQLKGIGPYTAAAIASIAFGEAVPVVDGNVFRFIARYFGVHHDISETKNRKHFEEILQTMIPADDPGTFNQAVMEFGARVCTPASPDCGNCIFRENCFARKHGQIANLPVKVKKTKVTERHLSYFVFNDGNGTLMRARTSSIWTGLYEFYAIESPLAISNDFVLEHLNPYTGWAASQVSEPVLHLLSHRRLWVTFHEIRINQNLSAQIAKDWNLHPYSWEEVLTLPRPKVIVNYLRQAAF